VKRDPVYTSLVYFDFQVDPTLYLFSFDLPKFNRSLITKIRISAHQLAIETGRYMKPPLPVPERFCKNCKNKVEDEKYFILYCPLYKNLRNKYIINEESQSDSD
jgi:hypothetical protein